MQGKFHVMFSVICGGFDHDHEVTWIQLAYLNIFLLILPVQISKRK